MRRRAGRLSGGCRGPGVLEPRAAPGGDFGILTLGAVWLAVFDRPDGKSDGRECGLLTLDAFKEPLERDFLIEQVYHPPRAIVTPGAEESVFLGTSDSEFPVQATTIRVAANPAGIGPLFAEEAGRSPLDSPIFAARWEPSDDLVAAVWLVGKGQSAPPANERGAVHAASGWLSADVPPGAPAALPAAREHGAIRPLRLGPPVLSWLSGGLVSTMSGGSGGEYDYSTHAPVSSGGLDEIFHWEGDSADYVNNIAGHFSDSDIPYGDVLTFSADSSNTGVAAVTIDQDGDYTIDFGELGVSQITFTATDRAGQQAATMPPMTV